MQSVSFQIGFEITLIYKKKKNLGLICWLQPLWTSCMAACFNIYYLDWFFIIDSATSFLRVKALIQDDL